MDFLLSLGVDASFFIQFGLFVVSYLFLLWAFEAYYKAHKARELLTRGATDQSGQIQSQIENTKAEYGNRMKLLSAKIDDQFANQKAEALKEREKIIADAKLRGEHMVIESEKQIKENVLTAEKNMEQHVQGIGRSISECINH